MLFYLSGALTCCTFAPDGIAIVVGESRERIHFLQLEGGESEISG